MLLRTTWLSRWLPDNPRSTLFLQTAYSRRGLQRWQIQRSWCDDPKSLDAAERPRATLQRRRSHTAAVIDPTSLRATLESHREQNKSSLFRKIKVKGIKEQRLQVAWDRYAQNAPRRATGESHIRPSHPDSEQKNDGKRTRAEATEYQGRPRDLSRQWKVGGVVPRSAKFPWLSSLHAPCPESMDQLNQEVRAFGLYLSPDAQEKAAAAQAVHDIVTCAQAAAPTARIEVVGSQATGLAAPFSDLDLNLVPAVSTTVSTKRKTESQRASVTRVLKTLRQQMQSENANLYKPQPNPVRISTFLDEAAVPIITGIHRPTGLRFQIQSTNDSFVSTQLTKDWLLEFPTIHPLLMVLKQTLSMRGLTSGPGGGLTTYPLLGMIVTALRLSQGRVALDDAAAHLLFFLDVYCDIDFYTRGISLNPLQYVSKTPSSTAKPESLDAIVPDVATDSCQRSVASTGTSTVVGKTEWMASLTGNRPFMMSVQDPANPYNDLGKGCTLIKHVQATLIHLRQELRTAMRAWDDMEMKPRTMDDVPRPLLASLIEGDYGLFEDERNELKRNGLRRQEEET